MDNPVCTLDSHMAAHKNELKMLMKPGLPTRIQMGASMKSPKIYLSVQYLTTSYGVGKSQNLVTINLNDKFPVL